MSLKLLAAFGDHTPDQMLRDEDTLDQLSFSGCDRYVASGDHGGRISVYRIKETNRARNPLSFSLAAKVQAFTTKYEATRESPANPKVTSLQWLPRVDHNPLFLAANHCEVRLFRVGVVSKAIWGKSGESLFPAPTKTVDSYSVNKVALFRDDNSGDIAKILCLADQTSFVAVDSGGARLWNIEHPKAPFVLFDNHAYEVTAAGLNPASPSVFAFADASGSVKTFDMGASRVTAVFDTAQFCVPTYADPAVTSVKYEPSGNLFAVRNFSHLQVWDARMSERPLAVQEVQWSPSRGDYARSGDTAHDAFGSLFTKSGSIYSGLFGQCFVAWDWKNSVITNHRASRRSTGPPEAAVDFTKKVSRIVSNQAGNVIGVASTASIFFYQISS